MSMSKHFWTFASFFSIEKVNSSCAPAASPMKAPIRDPLMLSVKSVGVDGFIMVVSNTK